MRLEELLQRGLMRLGKGGIVSIFRIRARRNVLFFEDIIANYIKRCEELGRKDITSDVGWSWSYLTAQELIPYVLKKLPIEFLINTILNSIWSSYGVLNKIHLKKKGNLLEVETEYQYISRLIGQNEFSSSFGAGVLSALLGRQVKCVKSYQRKASCKYVFKIGEKDFGTFPSRGVEPYIKFNRTYEDRSSPLKDMMNVGIIKMKGNQFLFKGRLITPVEVTLFHILGLHKDVIEEVPKISFAFFEGLIEKDITPDKKIYLLKNLLEATGWGTVNVLQKGKEIDLEISNPPYGLQATEEDWDFLARVIEGYLWHVFPNCIWKDVNFTAQRLRLIYRLQD